MSTKLKRADTVWPKAAQRIKPKLEQERHSTKESQETQSDPLSIPQPSQQCRDEGATQIALSRAAGVRNPFTVPTAQSLGHSIVVTSKLVWDLYDAIEYCSNQGDNIHGYAVLSRRKRPQPYQDESLFVVKQHQYTSN